MSSKPSLVVLQGGKDTEQVDWAYLLEEMDLRDSLPLMRQLLRKAKPAANSTLTLVHDANEPAQRPK